MKKDTFFCEKKDKYAFNRTFFQKSVFYLKK